MAALTKTDRCWAHTYSKERTEAQRRGIATVNAKKKLERTQKQLDRAAPGVIAKFNLTESQVAKLRDVEGLMAWSEYCSGLILRHEISAPEGQALAAFTRIAKELISLQTEIRVLDLETIEVKGEEL